MSSRGLLASILLLLMASGPARGAVKVGYLEVNPDAAPRVCELTWEDGSPAVAVEAVHAGLSGLSAEDLLDARECYGLHLTVYVFSDKGRGNCFNGGHSVTVGTVDDQAVLLRSKRFDCGDLRLTIEVEDIRFVPYPSPDFQATGFVARLRIEAEMY
jgi:hypothetical protein